MPTLACHDIRQQFSSSSATLEIKSKHLVSSIPAEIEQNAKGKPNVCFQKLVKNIDFTAELLKQHYEIILHYVGFKFEQQR